MPTPRRIRPLALCAPLVSGLMLLAGAWAPALAQEEDDPLAATSDIATPELGDASRSATSDLEAVEQGLAVTTDRINQIRAEIEALGGDASRLGAELAAAGQRVDLAGEDIRVIEDRLEALFASERTIRDRLVGHDNSITNLLGSLQRITAQPPPAIIVDPTDALGSARAALLLGAVLPQLQARAEAVTADLNELLDLKRTVMAEAERLNANLTVLNEERLRIATIIEARNRGMEWLSEDLLREEAEAQALADRATSLEQLIRGLEARIAALNAAGAANRAANAGETIPALDPETLRLAFADTDRTEPAVPIASARGYLKSPVAGPPVVTYGAADGFGGTAKGLSIAAAADATVIAPADGWVVFTGPFLNYGQIVILNAGQDYLLVLAGLETVEVERGQFVQMGTRLGVMGEVDRIDHFAGHDGASGPTLYVELRESGIPIDPAGWWTTAPEQQESGSS